MPYPRFGYRVDHPHYPPLLCKLPIQDGQLRFPRMVATGLSLTTVADSWVEAIPTERRATPDIDDLDVGAAIQIGDQHDAPGPAALAGDHSTQPFFAGLGTAHHLLVDKHSQPYQSTRRGRYAP